MSMTIFLLAARFDGRPAVDLDEVADMFGLSGKAANERAAKRILPIPCFRLADSQRAPWMVRIDDLATYIDRQRDAANDEKIKVNSL